MRAAPMNPAVALRSSQERWNSSARLRAGIASGTSGRRCVQVVKTANSAGGKPQVLESPIRKDVLVRGIAGFTACFAWACGNIVEPPLPAGAVPMAPLPQYTLWWKLTERCAARTSDLARVRWYVVPGVQFLGSPTAQGEYYPLSHRIVLAGGFVDIPPLVRHEMLHAILGVGGHPAEAFQRDCGGVVACDAACLADGGKLPPADTSGPVVRPVDVDVSARVDSTQPSMARDSGWAAITVAIHNSRLTPVRVHLASLGQGYWGAYGYDAAYCDNPTMVLGTSDHSVGYDSTIALGAGEAQLRVFDFAASGVCFIVTPFFADDTLPAIRIQPQP